MKKIFLILPVVLLLLLSGCTDKPDALDIIIKTIEKYKNMQDFKAVKIIKQSGYIITNIKEIEIKGNKYKIIEDDKFEVSDGTNIWSYNINGPSRSILYFPENGSSLDINNLHFVWGNQGNNEYVFQIDEKKDFSSLSLPDLINNKKYYWRVYPVDVNGKFNQSTAKIREFKVESNIEYEFKSPDLLSKILMVYNGTKSKIYTAFPLGKNITDNPMIKAYDSITMNKSTSNLLASLTKKDGKYVIDNDKLNKDLELEIKDNLLLQEIKDIKIDKNKIIIDKTVKPVTEQYIDDVQIIDKILDIYAMDFKVKDVDDRFYIIEGKEAKKRLRHSLLWNKIKVWINKDDYSVYKMEFYSEVDKRDILFTTIIYEDISFNNNLSDEEFMLIKR